MSSRFSFIVSYDGEMVDGESGVEYIGGSHRFVSLDEDLSLLAHVKPYQPRLALKVTTRYKK